MTTSEKRKSKRSRIVCNGFVYHTSVLRQNPPVRYLCCSKYISSRCHGRAVLPLNESVDKLRITQPHNHPPDNTVEEKFSFMKKLKCAVQNAPNTSFKKVFDGMAELEPKISKQFSYESIRSSMRRWRKEVSN